MAEWVEGEFVAWDLAEFPGGFVGAPLPALDEYCKDKAQGKGRT